jgi:hypothetical protein
MGGFNRFCLTTKSWTPAASHACTSASASASEIAIGFSVTTCLPARAALMPCAGWRPDGVQTETTSQSTAANSSSSVRNAGMPWLWATSFARSISTSATATSSRPSIFSIAET